MKILSLNFYHKLPDEFDGTYEDAIRSYLEYRASRNYDPNQIWVGKVENECATKEELWDRFWEIIHTTDYKVYGEGCVVELLEDNTWRHMTKDTPHTS